MSSSVRWTKFTPLEQPPHPVPLAPPAQSPRYELPDLAPAASGTTASGGSVGWGGVRSTSALAELRSAPTSPTERFLALSDALTSLPSLDPSPRVNALFSELVGMTATTDGASTAALLEDPRVQARLPKLRETCARGEARLERFWAKSILGAKDPAAAAEGFPYINNYRKLVHMEVKAMEMAGALPQRLLFIGSGPLPLSSHLMAEEHGIRVDNLDIDARACRDGEAVCRAMGNRKMGFSHGDVLSMGAETLGRYDAIYVAALAGLTRSAKSVIFEHLQQHAKDDAILVARSATRLRTLLYPTVEPEDVKGFSPVVLVHPLDDVVNSALVLRKAPD